MDGYARRGFTGCCTFNSADFAGWNTLSAQELDFIYHFRSHSAHLVIQGLTLPFLIKKFKIQDPDFTRSEKEIDYEIRNELAKIGVKRIRDTHFEKLEKFPALQDQLQTWENLVNSSEVIVNFPEYREIYLDIINQQREWLISKNREEILLDEEIIRKHLKMLDLQEEKLGMH